MSTPFDGCYMCDRIQNRPQTLSDNDLRMLIEGSALLNDSHIARIALHEVDRRKAVSA